MTTKKPCSIRLRPISLLKEIDITPPQGKKSILGIYELKDDELKLCLRHASSHKGRPTEFSTKPDTQLILLSLNKQPK